MSLYPTTLLLLLVIFCIILCDGHQITFEKSTKAFAFNKSSCATVKGFTEELRFEIHSKVDDVKRIINLVLNGSEKHSTYNELALLCDTFGPRMSGSDSLDQAIKYMMKKMKDDSKLQVYSEKAMIPKWEIGEQWAELVEPVKHRMTILAFGKSVGTNGTIEAEVALVHSFEELDSLGNDGKLKNKIVVYTYTYTSYGESVKFRSSGAKRAAKYGALAALVRSVTPFSIYSPHTGVASQSIPTAALTVEDTDKIERWSHRNKKIVLKLSIDAKNLDDVESSNIIAEIPGSDKPDEVVLVSGHIDSWYNTDGAMDDGGGAMISYKALDVLNKLNLRAKRTIRAILWTSEEFGLIGAQQYFKDHSHEIDKFKVVMESDLGTFKPLGLSIAKAGPLGQCIVNEVISLTERIGTNKLDFNYEGSDIQLFTDAGVPSLSLSNENSKYFYYHHTSGDSISIENPDDLDRSTIVWAVASYVLADLSVGDLRQ